MSPDGPEAQPHGQYGAGTGQGSRGSRAPRAGPTRAAATTGTSATRGTSLARGGLCSTPAIGAFSCR
jgi:hypothetical protein